LKTWNALYVNSRAEKKIMHALQEKNIEAYVPIRKTLKQWSDRKKWVEEPLIRGYVFVNIEVTDREKVFSVSGIVNFLRFNGKDAIIREKEIEALKRLIELGYSIEAEAIEKNYKPGDVVYINDGPLKGLEGVISKTEFNTKVEVIMSSIGQVIKVQVPAEILLVKK